MTEAVNSSQYLMKLRDQFAGQVVQGWLSTWPEDAEVDVPALASWAYGVADAMLEAREK